jgi:hypothetical protein
MRSSQLLMGAGDPDVEFGDEVYIAWSFTSTCHLIFNEMSWCVAREEGLFYLYLII